MTKTYSRVLLVIAFMSGLSIMAMEISASRLLAPYFGASLFVWTNIIGIVMAALSFGYYYGGRLADRIPRINFLLKLIFTAGVLFLTIPLTIKPITYFVDISAFSLQSASTAIFISSLIVTIMLFALPIFLLGMVSPFVIKLYSVSREDQVGELSGNVFAVSTVGSILGTFLPTLYFIPVLGTKMTISIFAIILIVMGSFGFKDIKLRLGVFMFLFLTIVFLNNSTIKDRPGLIFEDESAYQYISVVDGRNDNRYLVFNEGGGFQSMYNKSNVLTDSYYDYFNALPYLVESDGKKKALIVGLAGGTIAGQLNYFFNDAIEVEGVEIDKKVIEIAKSYFNLDDSKVKVYNQDGRMFLRTADDKYDLIIIDAYQNEIHIPWTMTTQEFWELIKERLTKNGIAAINVNSTSRESPLLNSIVNTMASVYDNTYLTPIQGDSWNYMIIASENNIDFQSLNDLVVHEKLLDIASILINHTEEIKYNDDQVVLTDDRAPIEFMTEAMVYNFLKTR